jgi:DNA-binding CsgD family transcriptional regulator
VQKNARTKEDKVGQSASRAKTLEEGRKALGRRAWAEAHELLSAADEESAISPKDLEALAAAAHLSGHEVRGFSLLARAHTSFLNSGDVRGAARCAVWLGMAASFNGEPAQANGWLSRAGRLLESVEECVEHGYLLVPTGIRLVMQGKFAEGQAAFVKAAAIGKRFGNADLMALALNGQGRTLIRKGDVAGGVTLLDEAMVAVTGGEVSPIIAGVVYCSVLESCHETYDVQRAQEWTAALEQWCASQPEMVPYRGHCLLQRAEILQFAGDWQKALQEAEEAKSKLAEPPPKQALGSAMYRIAELHRLRGEFAEAEESYRQAVQQGFLWQPGFALLRLAQGQTEAAWAAIQRLADETKGSPGRAGTLAALVEIALTAEDVKTATEAGEELTKIAKRNGAPLLQAMAACAMGAVLLAGKDARGALAALRQGWKIWNELEAPYEAARARVLIAEACREQGDADAAELEIASACEAFRQFGAMKELRKAEALLRKGDALARNNGHRTHPVGGLTEREIQVLRLVASGKTNRGIAGKLGISEKTVARHMSNIFVKLDLNSRAAATAYAYEHGLIGSATQ